MTKQEIDKKYGRQPANDLPLVRKCRMLQSWYRVEECHETECGPWRMGEDCVGSTLLEGEKTRKNFITTCAFDYAQEKVREKRTINSDLTLDEYRLFNNMLSSQPMCFNLFADLRAGIMAGNDDASDALRAMFSESQIGTIERIEVEMMPQPKSEFIGDKTAFDAAILFTGKDGRNGIAAIETKYTDNLGSNRAKDETIKFKLSRELGLFTPAALRVFESEGFNQIARNFLLSVAYGRKFNRPNVISYVLSLDEDDEAKNVVEDLRKMLSPDFRECVRHLSLEDTICRGVTSNRSSEFAIILRKFEKRYLDFTPIRTLVE
jgi:hypothetical protein